MTAYLASESLRKFPTKKSFREAVFAGRIITIHIPTPDGIEIQQINSDLAYSTMNPGDKHIVTNHPKRSWFASVECVGHKQYKIK